MNPTCGDCGSRVKLERLNVVVRSGGDYLIVGSCCSFRHAAHKQYTPTNPRKAVSRVQGAVAADGGERQ